METLLENKLGDSIKLDQPTDQSHFTAAKMLVLSF